MRLAILGATGGIGRLLVSYALDQGHDVTVFARSPEKVQQQSSRLRIIGGNLFDQRQMADAIQSTEAVLSAFGPTTLRRTDERREFGRVVAAALRSSGVARLIHVSSALLFPDMGALGSVFSNTLFRNVVRDHANSEAELMQPDLAWTIVRPPRLTNSAPTGRTRNAEGHLPKGGLLIARADVASFMLQEAATPRFIHQFVGISN